MNKLSLRSVIVVMTLALSFPVFANKAMNNAIKYSNERMEVFESEYTYIKSTIELYRESILTIPFADTRLEILGDDDRSPNTGGVLETINRLHIGINQTDRKMHDFAQIAQRAINNGLTRFTKRQVDTRLDQFYNDMANFQNALTSLRNDLRDLVTYVPYYLSDEPDSEIMVTLDDIESTFLVLEASQSKINQSLNYFSPYRVEVSLISRETRQRIAPNTGIWRYVLEDVKTGVNYSSDRFTSEYAIFELVPHGVYDLFAVSYDHYKVSRKRNINLPIRTTAKRVRHSLIRIDTL